MDEFRTEDLFYNRESLSYNDISLIPNQISEIEHRSDIDTSSEFLGLKLDLPVLSSPMESVTGQDMCKALNNLGCLGILNRFRVSAYNGVKAISIGLDTDLERFLYLFRSESEFNPILCLDVANAANRFVINKATEIKRQYPGLKLIVGNIATADSLFELNKVADAVRVGIGNGSVCSTSIKTGIGIGQVSSLVEVIESKKKYGLGIKIIADGGISTSGEICKALALGADAVMLGRMFAGTKETPGEYIKYNGVLYKKYRGSASYGVKGNRHNIEGEETLIEYKGSVSKIVEDIKDGLQSSMSYLNAKTLDEYRENAIFTILSHSSYIERLSKG